MKKLLSLFFVFLMLFSFSPAAFAGYEGKIDSDSFLSAETKKTEDIFIRDPCVLVYENKYYMYGTGAATKEGYGCYVSEDLENWAGPFNVFEADSDESFDGNGCYWAPECYYYNGSFYLFATYMSASSGHRGVSVFKSSSPLGPFEEISDGHITPKSWDSIDGSLYVDKNGDAWMIFVHEWTSMPDEIGDMSYAKLSEDLSEFVTEPVKMFDANDPLWTTSGVTDGPFPYRTKNGNLILLWSNSAIGSGYCVGIAKSSNGEIDGKWRQELFPLYSKGYYRENDGGHGMIFTDLDGRLVLSIHSPNSSTEDNMTHAVFIELEDTGSTVKIKGEYGKAEDFFYRISLFFKYTYRKTKYFFKHLF